jgi:thymidylate synthase ThyX
MRCTKYAEPEIRALAYKIYQIMVAQEPLLFSDYLPVQLLDGSFILETDTHKV